MQLFVSFMCNGSPRSTLFVVPCEACHVRHRYSLCVQYAFGSLVFNLIFVLCKFPVLNYTFQDVSSLEYSFTMAFWLIPNEDHLIAIDGCSADTILCFPCYCIHQQEVYCRAHPWVCSDTKSSFRTSSTCMSEERNLGGQPK